MSDPIDDIFGEPALLEGEDRERYNRLYAAVEADIQPKSFFDRMQVREQTDKIWEELRYRRSSADLVSSAYVEALASLLTPIYEAKKLCLTSAPEAAVHFYGGDPRKKKNVADEMLQHGITPAIIQAKAMQVLSGTLQLFGRLIMQSETSRRHLRKEHERRVATDGGTAAE